MEIAARRAKDRQDKGRRAGGRRASRRWQFSRAGDDDKHLPPSLAEPDHYIGPQPAPAAHRPRRRRGRRQACAGTVTAGQGG
ncbi:MAG: hypothetical protein R3D62_11840 [Xanthobacteraceae bacterium]